MASSLWKVLQGHMLEDYGWVVTDIREGRLGKAS